MIQHLTLFSKDMNYALNTTQILVVVKLICQKKILEIITKIILVYIKFAQVHVLMIILIEFK